MIEKGGFEIENEYADRIVAPQVTKEETDEFEVSLRPKTLAEYIGQDKVKDNLSIYIQAAKSEATALTTFCSTDLRVLARRHFRLSSLTKWALTYA